MKNILDNKISNRKSKKSNNSNQDNIIRYFGKYFRLLNQNNNLDKNIGISVNQR